MESIGVIANTAGYLDKQLEDDSSEYWYYKYCAEEWELFHTFEEISSDLNQYLEENDAVFTDPNTYEYTEVFNEHCENIIERCINALIQVRQFLSQKNSDIILDFNIREYLDAEDKIEIFEKLNSRDVAEEYTEHIEEFV